MCVCAHSYITRRWLAAFGYDVQIRTVRDYIIVWRGAGLLNFLHGRAELAAASEAQRKLLLICLSSFLQ